MSKTSGGQTCKFNIQVDCEDQSKCSKCGWDPDSVSSRKREIRIKRKEEKKMQPKYIIGDNLADAYHKALTRLFFEGRVVDCPDYNTQRLETNMTIEVATSAIDCNSITKFMPCDPWGLASYEEEIVHGIRNFEVENGKWPYTYNLRITKFASHLLGNLDEAFNQLVLVRKELRRNPASTRAVITIRDPEDFNLSDPPCLQNIQFTIRNGRLDMYVLFRSNDAWSAFYMNAWALMALQRDMAQKLFVKPGKYVHTANSFHVYAKDFKKFEAAVMRILSWNWNVNIKASEQKAFCGRADLDKEYSNALERISKAPCDTDSSIGGENPLVLDSETGQWFLDEIERLRPEVIAWARKRCSDEAAQAKKYAEDADNE